MERYHNNVQDALGNAITGVTVTVRRVSDGGLASIFSDDGVTGKANPFTNDSDGEFFFYAANNRYDIFFTGPITDQIDDVLLYDPDGVGTALKVFTDTDAPAGPTGQVGTGHFQIWDLDDDTQLAQLGFIGGGNGNLRLRSFVRAGHQELTSHNTGGTEVFLAVGDPDAFYRIYYAGTLRFGTGSAGAAIIYSDTSTDAEQRILTLAHANATVRAVVGHTGGSTLRMNNQIHGGNVQLDAEDAGGTNRTVLIGDPDGVTDIFYNGTLTLSAAGLGIVAVRGDLNTDTDNRYIDFRHADGTVRGRIGHFAGTDFHFRNEIHGGFAMIEAEDTGGVVRTILQGDPDAITSLMGDTDVQILVNVGAEVAVEAVANGKVGLRYDAVETFRTSDEQGADIGMGAEVRHDDQSFYPVGMNVVPEDAGLDSGNVTLDLEHVGKMLTYNTGTARSLLFNNISDTRLGSMWALKVGPSAGTLTGDGGTGVQIRYWNGSGWTTTAAAGNITIGVGSYNIWKETDTLYWIDGPTLS